MLVDVANAILDRAKEINVSLFDLAFAYNVREYIEETFVEDFAASLPLDDDDFCWKLRDQILHQIDYLNPDRVETFDEDEYLALNLRVDGQDISLFKETIEKRTESYAYVLGMSNGNYYRIQTDDRHADPNEQEIEDVDIDGAVFGVKITSLNEIPKNILAVIKEYIELDNNRRWEDEDGDWYDDDDDDW